jgi:transcriptional regulator EpsA
MKTLRTNASIPRWLDGCANRIDEEMPGLDAHDGARFVRVLSESRLVRRHGELLRWLNEVQQFLPHEILIAAWGDFQRWNIKCEVVSHLPDVCAAPRRGCALDDLLRDLYTQWVRSGREPLVLQAALAAALRKPCACALHGALRGMRCVLVHGVRDKRSGCDSLYITLGSSSFGELGHHSRFIALAHLLLCQLDIVWRRLAAFRLDDLPADEAITLPRALELSAREREILVSLSRGSSNSDIAEALDISLFTVKNHLKRIFRKIGVSNRTQAAARYNDALARYNGALTRYDGALTQSAGPAAPLLAAQQKAA